MFQFIRLYFLFLSILSTYSSLWASKDLKDFHLEKSNQQEIYNISLLGNDLTSTCLYENVILKWDYEADARLNHFVVVSKKGYESVYLHQLHTQKTLKSEKYTGIIKCEIYEEDCIPSIDSITAITDDPGSPRIIVNFKQHTNQPTLLSTVDVIKALYFDPPITGIVIGNWIDPKRLELFVTADYLSAVLEHHKSQRTIIIEPKSATIATDITGYISLHNTEYGEYSVFIVRQNYELISNIVTYNVATDCSHTFPLSADLTSDDINMSSTLYTSLLLPSFSDKLINCPTKPALTAVIKIDGVIAVNSQNALVIPQSAVPAMVSVFALLCIYCVSGFSYSLYVYICCHFVESRELVTVALDTVSYGLSYSLSCLSLSVDIY